MKWWRRQGVTTFVAQPLDDQNLAIATWFWYQTVDTLAYHHCIGLWTNLYPLPVLLPPCSVFGEDALVNVSVEKKEDNDGKLAGYIRIRSKTQGIALSLGDRITSVQRGIEK